MKKNLTYSFIRFVCTGWSRKNTYGNNRFFSLQQ